MDLFSIALGAGGVGAAYFAYLCAAKGLPAALAWIKAKWNAGKAAASALQADIDDAHHRITSLESRLVSAEASIVTLAKPAPATAPAAATAAPPAPSFIATAGNGAG